MKLDRGAYAGVVDGITVRNGKIVVALRDPALEDNVLHPLMGLKVHLWAGDNYITEKNKDDFMNEKWCLLSFQEEVIDEIDGLLFISAIDAPAKGCIKDSDDINSIDSCTKIVLSESDVQKIFEQDEAFGCLVGSEYFYFAMPVKLKDAVVLQGNNDFILKGSSVLILMEDGIEQEIFIL